MLLILLLYHLIFLKFLYHLLILLVFLFHHFQILLLFLSTSNIFSLLFLDISSIFPPSSLNTNTSPSLPPLPPSSLFLNVFDTSSSQLSTSSTIIIEQGKLLNFI